MRTLETETLVEMTGRVMARSLLSELKSLYDTLSVAERNVIVETLRDRLE